MMCKGTLVYLNIADEECADAIRNEKEKYDVCSLVLFLKKAWREFN